MFIENIRKTNNIKIIFISLICFVLGGIFIASTKETNISNKLSTPIIEFTGWRISHFLLHLLLGFLFPNKFILFFCLGILWEIIEYIIGLVTNSNWWGETLWAHFQDIIANSLGFVIGMCIMSTP